VWGLDIIGPLRKAPGGYTHLLVTVDKFSKWIEACPITNLRAEQVVSFFTDIIHRFGVSNSIITDNGSQFTGRKFLEFCDKHHIHVDWAAVAHPQTNGQVERANDMILQGLKPRIFDRLNKSGRKWLQELSSVIWSLRTTPSRAMGFTPFFLVYGAEAVLPTNLEYGSPKVKGYDENANQRARDNSLDQLDEAHTMALMHSARYQQALRRYQAQKIRRRDFDEGDLILRLRQNNLGHHKLLPPWERPYFVVKVLKPDTYKLANEDGEELTNAWNIQQLRRFYP
jgi:transposase InsO family protein